MEKEVIEWIGQHIVSILIVLSIFIQIAPIKINPWSALIKWVGKTLTANLHDELENVKESITDPTANVDENEKDRIRWEVLDFATSCREGRKHSKDEFQHIIALNDKYERLLSKTNDKNGVFNAEYQYIQRVYAERQEKNDFV